MLRHTGRNMALDDIVLDTNVLMHAADPRQPSFQASIDFLEALLNSSSRIAVDEDAGFSPASRSKIVSEYLSKLVTGTYSFAVMAALARSGRLKEIPDGVPAQIGAKINQMIRNRRDRTFVRIGFLSTEKTFVSHDFVDFPESKRRSIEKDIGVAMYVAATATPLV